MELFVGDVMDLKLLPDGRRSNRCCPSSFKNLNQCCIVKVLFPSLYLSAMGTITKVNLAKKYFLTF